MVTEMDYEVWKDVSEPETAWKFYGPAKHACFYDMSAQDWPTDAAAFLKEEGQT